MNKIILSNWMPHCHIIFYTSKNQTSAEQFVTQLVLNSYHKMSMIFGSIIF